MTTYQTRQSQSKATERDSEARAHARLRLARVFAAMSADVPVWRQVRNRILSVLLQAPQIRMGSNVRLDRSHAELGGKLLVGSDVEIGAQAILDVSGGITIGNRVTVSQGVLILSHDHVVDSALSHWRKQGRIARPVHIEDEAWIGARAVLLGKARSVGSGGIVGAGSVVTGPVAPSAVVAGNPAREVKRRTID